MEMVGRLMSAASPSPPVPSSFQGLSRLYRQLVLAGAGAAPTLNLSALIAVKAPWTKHLSSHDRAAVSALSHRRARRPYRKHTSILVHGHHFVFLY